MEWIRQGIQRIKKVLGFGKNISTEDCLSMKETVTVKQSSSVIIPIFGLRMRPRKDLKTRNKDVAKSVEDILKIRKPNQRTFKSPIVRPVRVKKGSTWMQRLLSSSSNSASSNDQDILDYFRVSVSNDVEEPVWKTYASRFLKREHFNFVGSDKNLGPLVISIKYPNVAMIKSNNFKETLDKKYSEKTSLILRLPSGIMKRSWNQFQLINPTVKSPLELAKLSFPSLVFSCGLLPVFYPDIGEIIAKYDETCNTDGISNRSNEVVTQEIDIETNVETSSKSTRLKTLQRKLITSTCKFIEHSGWNLDAYEVFFAEKKASPSKFTSFSLPLTLKTPKMCSKLVKKSKSPKFLSLPRKVLFDYEVPSPPGALSMEGHLDDDDRSLEVNSIENNDVRVLGGQMIKLRVENKDLGGPVESDEPDLEMRFRNLQLEKTQILKSNSLLEKEKEELCRSERRLVRELATAHTIIENLKRRRTST